MEDGILIFRELDKYITWKHDMPSFRRQPAIDLQLTSYYGNSLGGIMGKVYMAATTDVERG